MGRILLFLVFLLLIALVVTQSPRGSASMSTVSLPRPPVAKPLVRLRRDFLRHHRRPRLHCPRQTHRRLRLPQQRRPSSLLLEGRHKGRRRPFQGRLLVALLLHLPAQLAAPRPAPAKPGTVAVATDHRSRLRLHARIRLARRAALLILLTENIWRVEFTTWWNT